MVLEEVVNVDEEQRRSRPPSGGPAPQRPAAPSGPAEAPRPPPSRRTAAAGGGGGGPRRPAPSRGPLRLVLAGLAVLVVVGLAWLVVFRGGAGRPPAPKLVPPSPPPAAAPAVRGVKSDEILLGMAASFTGSNKERGRAMRTGWDAAIGAVNAAGGINGRKLRLLAVDDGYDPLRTGPAMRQLVEAEGVFAVVGNVGTATAAVSVPYCMEQKVVFFGPLSGADLLRKSPPDRYVFNYRASLGEEAAAAVRYLVDVKRVPPEKIAVLVQKDDFGESGWRGAVKQLAAAGVAPAGVLRLEYARNTADVREALELLKAHAAAVQAVVLVATYKPAATFIRKARDAGHDLLFASVSADSNGLAQELLESGARYTEGVVVTQVVPVPTSKATAVARYRQQLEQFAPGEPPGSTTLEAWSGAQLLFEALRRAGPELDGEKLVQALESLRDLDLGTGAVMGFGPLRHQACDKVWGWSLQPDGSYQQINLE